MSGPTLVYIVDEGGLVTLNVVIEGDLTRIALSPSNVSQLAADLSASTASFLRKLEDPPKTVMSTRMPRFGRRQLDS